MSTFEVKLYKLEIIPHPNADKIELAKVGDYVSVVGKGTFKTGDLGVYIPEQALVPPTVLQEIGLEGKLDGPDKNRVKAHKFRGVLSQGLIYPSKGWKEGQDVKELLGITKWEPVIPQHMRGRSVGVAQHITINYDIENIKKHTQLFTDGETVAITEKIHGTFAQYGYIPRRLFEPYLYLGAYTVTSKGLGGRGILLDMQDESNIYSRVGNDKRYGIGYKLPCIKAEYQRIIGDNPVYICGEIFGPGIQKGFGYGVPGNDTDFRMFDIAYGERSSLSYFPFELLWKIAKDYEIPFVPVLFVGPYSKDVVNTYTNGRETVSGNSLHIREGAVVKPFDTERQEHRAGRVILKSVSEAYLLRGGEVTEYS
jgi:RNA ligase (TIGR02306 family)